jgi:hypothetical protein
VSSLGIESVEDPDSNDNAGWPAGQSQSHPGSGNILMVPNDQDLSVVPRQTTAGHECVFLPLEGDGVLAVILSKAVLLADDTKTTDPSITSQVTW